MADPPVPLLPKPARRRDRFLVPVALYGTSAQLLIPDDMTFMEAQKIAAVVLAYAGVTAFNAKSQNIDREG